MMTYDEWRVIVDRQERYKREVLCKPQFTKLEQQMGTLKAAMNDRTEQAQQHEGALQNLRDRVSELEARDFSPDFSVRTELLPFGYRFLQPGEKLEADDEYLTHTIYGHEWARVQPQQPQFGPLYVCTGAGKIYRRDVVRGLKDELREATRLRQLGVERLATATEALANMSAENTVLLKNYLQRCEEYKASLKTAS